MKKCIDKRLKQCIHDTVKQNTFLSDLATLQLSHSPQIFEFASKLFVTKWRSESNELVTHFENEWLRQNPNWYEGYAIRVPSTNNALESFNRLVKDEQTLRERMDLSQFRIIICQMVRKWSIEYYSGLNKINDVEPKIDLKLWTDDYNWAKSGVDMQVTREANRTVYRPTGIGK